MSRIIVKNLPKHLKEDRFKEHFSKLGHITDVKIMKTSEGKSRLFGFIGFKTDKEARAAARYFNQTFIDTSKITVEVAKPIDDPSLPKPWSKFTLEKKAKEEAYNQKLKKEEKEKERLELEKAEKAKHIELLAQAKSDTKLKEFLEIMKPRSQTKTWGNEDIEMLNDSLGNERVKAKITAVANKKAGGQGQTLNKIHLKFDEDDDLYEDVPSKKEEEEEEVEKEEDKEDQVVNNLEISDMEYFKSRMKANLDEETQEEATVLETADDQQQEEVEDEVKKPVEENLSAESQILDNGRLFIRNLAYTCTELELRKLFGKFGPLSEVHIPISKENKVSKGFAYILYLLPEHALQAYKKLDNSFFQGRLLHILPSKDKLSVDVNFDMEPGLSLKKKNELKKKALSTNSYNWSSLFMNQNTIADALADRLGISKIEVMNPEADNLAVRLATAETQIIMETKQYFEKHHISIDTFDSKLRSDTVILVKNIPYNTTIQELEQLFAKHGELGRILIPPSKTIALVEFLHPTEARSAFRHLAYKRFGDAPLYLEKAPLNVFQTPYDPKIHNKMGGDDHDDDTEVIPEVEGKLAAVKDIIQHRSDDIKVEHATLFVKNLNFDTTTSALQQAFQHLQGFKSAIVRTKIHPKQPGKTLSLGFGFVEFENANDAVVAMKSMQGFMLDSHRLEIKISNQSQPANTKTIESTKPDQTKLGTKLLVKNVPFEATTQHLKQLFSNFGTLKSCRLPTKFGGGHRGFGFLEFTTNKEAQNVLDNLQHTHLLGRHLVVQRAEEENSIEGLREKTQKQFAKDNMGDDKKNKKRKVLMPDEEKKLEQDEF